MRPFTVLIILLFTININGQDLPVTTGGTVYLGEISAKVNPPSGYIYYENKIAFLNHLNQTSFSFQRKKNANIKNIDSNIELIKGATLVDKALINSNELLLTFQFEIRGKLMERLVYLKQSKKDVLIGMANYKQNRKDRNFDTLKKSLLSLSSWNLD